jgi:hypothetical protein
MLNGRYLLRPHWFSVRPRRCPLPMIQASTRVSLTTFYDHLEHQQFHQQFNDEHNAAHWWGFANPQQHEDWHRAYGATHEQFHEDHPGTWHDHYGYYGYRPYIGYQPYGYGGWYRGY